MQCDEAHESGGTRASGGKDQDQCAPYARARPWQILSRHEFRLASFGRRRSAPTLERDRVEDALSDHLRERFSDVLARNHHREPRRSLIEDEVLERRLEHAVDESAQRLLSRILAVGDVALRADGFLVELGRKLGYDSLHFTASPLAPLGTAYVSEVVDLRAPPGARHRTPDELAELWRALLPRRLSLRDPNDVGDEAAAAKCALPPLPTLRLACAGHVSETASAEPNRQNACRRR